MDLQQVVSEQASLIEELRAENAKLKALLQAALDEIERLKAEIARLKKNSTNSSKPPSSDIVKPPKQRKNKKRKRKIGAQKGHKAHQRIPFTAEQIDNIVEVKLEACPKCKGKLTPSDKPAKVHQQVELGMRTFTITEYRQLQYHCERCRRCHTAKKRNQDSSVPTSSRWQPTWRVVATCRTQLYAIFIVMCF